MPQVLGHVTGLKPNQITRLERLYRRRVPVDAVISPELARSCTELSHEIRRQMGLLINRRGIVESVVIGTDRQLVIPLLARSRSGSRLLRGVRFVHTHLHNQPLTKDDLTDLAMLRLDLMAVLGVGERGEPVSLALAHLLPPNPQGKAYEEWAPQSFRRFNAGAINSCFRLKRRFPKPRLRFAERTAPPAPCWSAAWRGVRRIRKNDCWNAEN